jgi:hypothetical protein
MFWSQAALYLVVPITWVTSRLCGAKGLCLLAVVGYERVTRNVEPVAAI